MNKYSRFTRPAKRTSSEQNQDLTIIIPCAGMGNRIKSYGSKSLIKIDGDICLIERQLNIFSELYPKAEIIIVVGYQEERLRKKLRGKNIRFVYNPLYEHTNVVFSIGLALRSCINSNVLIVYGDLIFNKYAIQSVVNKIHSKVVIDTKEQFRSEEVGVLVNSSHVLNFSYSMSNKWAQIVFMRDKELEMFRILTYNDEYRKMYCFEILNKIIDNGGMLKYCQPTKMKIIELDYISDLKYVKRVLND